MPQTSEKATTWVRPMQGTWMSSWSTACYSGSTPVCVMLECITTQLYHLC
jgi:hypothetical protein